MLIFIVWFVTIVLLIVNILFDTSNFWINGTIISGWILFAVQFSYSRWESFYILFNKIKYTFLNINSILHIKFIYRGRFNRLVFNELCEKLFSSNNNNINFQKIIPISNVRSRLVAEEFELEVYFNEDDGEIQVTFKEIRIGYRDILNFLQNEIHFVNECLNKYINYETNDYYLKIKFKNSNPFFGFYFHKINTKTINSYYISFIDGQNFIDIDSTSINIRSKSYSDFLKVTKKYITISSKH